MNIDNNCPNQYWTITVQTTQLRKYTQHSYLKVQDWTKINRTPNEYYFIFDTRDKIPNEYFIDLKVISSGEINTYKKQIKFQIVNKK